MGSIVPFDNNTPRPPLNVWIEAIRTRWGKGLDAVFDTGQALLDAKAALPHGQFEIMISSQLPFTHGTARKLMTIAAKPILANRSIRNVLPVAWTVVYELCHIDDAELTLWFEQGKIRPSLTARDVYETRSEHRPRRRASLYASISPPPPAAQQPALPPALPPPPHQWAEKVIDTLQSLVRQFDGVDLAGAQRDMKHQQTRDLAALIRTARIWFDVLEVSKGERK